MIYLQLMKSLDKIKTKIALMIITAHATTIGIIVSMEKVSFGICNNTIAGSEIYITNWFKIIGASFEKIFNLFIP